MKNLSRCSHVLSPWAPYDISEPAIRDHPCLRNRTELKVFHATPNCEPAHVKMVLFLTLFFFPFLNVKHKAKVPRSYRPNREKKALIEFMHIYSQGGVLLNLKSHTPIHVPSLHLDDKLLEGQGPVPALRSILNQCSQKLHFFKYRKQFSLIPAIKITDHL